MKAVPLAAVLSFAAAAAADPPRRSVQVALAGGAGVAFGRVGAHAELIAGHVALFGGAGYDLNVSEGPAWAAGLRFFSGRGEGAMLSLNFAYLKKHVDTAPAVPINEFVEYEDVYLGATVGWRLRPLQGFFLEAGVGPAWLRARSYHRQDFGPHPAPEGCSGTWPFSCDNRGVILDLSAAAGFAF